MIGRYASVEIRITGEDLRNPEAFKKRIMEKDRKKWKLATERMKKQIEDAVNP